MKSSQESLSIEVILGIRPHGIGTKLVIVIPLGIARARLALILHAPTMTWVFGLLLENGGRSLVRNLHTNGLAHDVFSIARVSRWELEAALCVIMTTLANMARVSRVMGAAFCGQSNAAIAARLLAFIGTGNLERLIPPKLSQKAAI